MSKSLIAVLVLAALTSCVSTKKFDSMKAEALRLDGELSSARGQIEDLNGQIDKLNGDKARLIQDTTRLYNDYRYSRARHEELQEKYRQLLDDGSAEAARLLRELESNQQTMEQHARRVAELEAMLKSREEAIDALRRTVTDALVGFEGKGLSISVRDGNVYVSMDDKLLFRSGSFQIDPNGARAVRDLAVVLGQNPDINVMVEGHTDDVPYRPNGNLQDNLDLSAKRATTVVRLLLENGQIAPNRIIAAGRGESLPVDPGKSSEARARNRRTEIILTPKLVELMQLMENNGAVPGE